VPTDLNKLKRLESKKMENNHIEKTGNFEAVYQSSFMGRSDSIARAVRLEWKPEDEVVHVVFIMSRSRPCR
jgi:hypothetical protein